MCICGASFQLCLRDRLISPDLARTEHRVHSTREAAGGSEVLRGINLRTALLEIGKDYVLAVWENELGVEQVRLYRILKT